MKRREPLNNTQLLTTIAVCIFAVMYIAAIVTGVQGFEKFQMFFDLLNDNAYLIIISCALSIVMIGGGINISVGGVISLTVMACSIFLNNSAPQNELGIIVTLLLALGIGLAFGVGQGFLISYLEIQPFIVTLAGMFLSLVVVLCFLMLRYIKLGRNIYALGGNQQSALMLGINVKRTRFMSYVISGLLSGIAGFVFLMHKPTGNASVAMRSEMDAIAASIIGGTLLTGGVGNVIGTFFGTMILATIQKIIGMSKLNDSWWQDMASGALLGVFILLQSVILSARDKAKAKKAGAVSIAKG